MDLDKIHRIFNVRLLTSIRQLPTFRSQTELAVRDDANTPDVLSDPLPGIYHETSKDYDEMDNENRPVSLMIRRPLPIIEPQSIL